MCNTIINFYMFYCQMTPMWEHCFHNQSIYHCIPLLSDFSESASATAWTPPVQYSYLLGVSKPDGSEKHLLWCEVIFLFFCRIIISLNSDFFLSSCGLISHYNLWKYNLLNLVFIHLLLFSLLFWDSSFSFSYSWSDLLFLFTFCGHSIALINSSL